MGAYKMRGATNAIMLLSDDQKSKGVVTHSSGNFAQALSLAAKKSRGKSPYCDAHFRAAGQKRTRFWVMGAIFWNVALPLRPEKQCQKKSKKKRVLPSSIHRMTKNVIIGQGNRLYRAFGRLSKP